MADPIMKFECLDARQFCAAYSSAPSAAPYLAIYADSGNATLVESLTMTGSSALAYYGFFTMPNTPNVHYAWEIVAYFGAGSRSVNRGLFKVVRTTAG